MQNEILLNVKVILTETSAFILKWAGAQSNMSYPSIQCNKQIVITFRAEIQQRN